MSEQKTNIKKTVLMLIAIMVTILILFFNKITTPRYLSNIELKVNGFILIDEAKGSIVEGDFSKGQWSLVVTDEEDKRFLDTLLPNLKSKVNNQLTVVDGSILTLNQDLNTTTKIIPILKPSGEFLGYFKSPFDHDKMILTLSSIVTHH